MYRQVLSLEFELRLIPIPELELKLKIPSCPWIRIEIESSNHGIGIETLLQNLFFIPINLLNFDESIISLLFLISLIEVIINFLF